MRIFRANSIAACDSRLDLDFARTFVGDITLCVGGLVPYFQCLSGGGEAGGLGPNERGGHSSVMPGDAGFAA